MSYPRISLSSQPLKTAEQQQEKQPIAEKLSDPFRTIKKLHTLRHWIYSGSAS